MSKMIHLSMYGPNVLNWKFIETLKKDLWYGKAVSDKAPRFLKCGSCGLYVIHGAIGTGHGKSWLLESEVLDVNTTSAYNLF